jgi:hypothetical protein
MRSYYESFLIMYTCVTAAVVVWNGVLVWEKPVDTLITRVWIAAMVLYLFIGVLVWTIDMNMCYQLLPYYLKYYGANIHIIWHITAAYGTYVGLLDFILIRARVLKMDIKIEWAFGCIPVAKRVENSANSSTQRNSVKKD